MTAFSVATLAFVIGFALGFVSVAVAMVWKLQEIKHRDLECEMREQKSRSKLKELNGYFQTREDELARIRHRSLTLITDAIGGIVEKLPNGEAKDMLVEQMDRCHQLSKELV